MEDAQGKTERWRQDYNEYRPQARSGNWRHSRSLKNQLQIKKPRGVCDMPDYFSGRPTLKKDDKIRKLRFMGLKIANNGWLFFVPSLASKANAIRQSS
jgi:hypothetical protein